MEEERKVVLNIGGSVLVPHEIDVDYINHLREMLLSFINEGYSFLIVVGGGNLARKYISAARSLGADESYLDEIGINASRLNAQVLISVLGEVCYPEVPTNFSEVVAAARVFPVVVMGGTHPGHTTDAVSAMLAERTKASGLIIATNVKGVYDKDPNQFEEAKLLKRLGYDALLQITDTKDAGAGKSAVVDSLACKIVKRAEILLKVVDGRNLENFKKAIAGEEFEGTVVG